MRKKPRVPFTKKFPGVDPVALHLLERLLAFDPKERPSAAEVGVVETNIFTIMIYFTFEMLNMLLQILINANVIQGPDRSIL